jgi:hypothetical protein
MELGFDVPATARRDGELAGIERRVASAVGAILKDEPRSRYDVAADMSRILDDDVSKMMLDAYASEARDTHNISAGRLLAIIAVTGRYDILRALLRPIGADLIVGEEILTVELGHIRAQQAKLAQREAEIKKIAPLIARDQRPKSGRKDVS